MYLASRPVEYSAAAACDAKGLECVLVVSWSVRFHRRDTGRQVQVGEEVFGVLQKLEVESCICRRKRHRRQKKVS